jgi:glycosyltransferase involved in cell wall biosynthesis
MKVSFHKRSEQLGNAQQTTKLTAKHQISSGAVKPCAHDGSAAEPRKIPSLVSVVVPTYNSAHHLKDAVESIFNQTYSSVECIVIDDGSTDHTRALLADLSHKYPGLKTATKANGGPSSARNMGLRLCSGEFVAFLDADDVMLPDKIARQTEVLAAHRDVGLLYSDYLVVSQNLQPLAVFVAEMPLELHPLDAFCYRNWFNPSVTLIRRTLIDEVGGFDEGLAVAEDWDYWIRCAKVGRMSYLPGAVALYRQHPGQMHRDHLKMRRACLQVAAKSFGDNRTRLRAATASIEWTHAKYLWRHHAIAASLVSLAKFAVSDRFGLHDKRMLRQLGAIFQSQLRPI